jgi:cytochrome b
MTAASHTTSIRPMASAHARPRFVVVWDPVVRLFHWLVVLGFMANMFVAEEGKLVHRWIGYGILALIMVRLVWGFVGSPYARFSNFVPTPSALWGYLKSLSAGREPRYIGHNPAAAIMMIALVLLLVVCGVTGWMQGLDAFWGTEWVQDVHKLSAYAILALAGVHALAAVVESLRHRENLIWSMITGRKRSPAGSDIDHAAASRRG